MRMSRRMGMLANLEMNPSEITVKTGSAMNYWSNGSQTSDKWHKTAPYMNDATYIGRNANGADHHAAICFTSGKFSGIAKNFSLYVQNRNGWGWTVPITLGWQLSKHNWKTEAEWAAGSKGYYSKSLYQTIPSDPNAIASGTFNIGGNEIIIRGKAKIRPNTQYVLYVFLYGSAQNGMLASMGNTTQYQPTITITG